MTTDTTTPRRLQASRRKGARKPENTIRVTRPGRYGNPYAVRQAGDGWAVVHDGETVGTFDTKDAATQYAVLRFKQDLIAGRLKFTVAEVRRKFAGKNVECYCRPDARWCHGDVLMSVAGSKRSGQQ